MDMELGVGNGKSSTTVLDGADKSTDNISLLVMITESYNRISL